MQQLVLLDAAYLTGPEQYRWGLLELVPTIPVLFALLLPIVRQLLGFLVPKYANLSAKHSSVIIKFNRRLPQGFNVPVNLLNFLHWAEILLMCRCLLHIVQLMWWIIERSLLAFAVAEFVIRFDQSWKICWEVQIVVKYQYCYRNVLLAIIHIFILSVIHLFIFTWLMQSCNWVKRSAIFRKAQI